jgi:hypothetical protein
MQRGGEVWDCIFHADELNANFLNVWMTSLQICSCFGSLNANFISCIPSSCLPKLLGVKWLDNVLS